MNKKNIFSVVILFLILSITVGFSAFASEMSIGKIVADVRVKKDIRITDVEFVSASNGGINSLDYETASIIGNINLNGINSTVTLQVSITNFGNEEMGIWDITGLSDNLIRIVDGYTLKSKLCDNSGSCKLGSTSTFNIIFEYDTYDAFTKDHDIKLDFDFREMHTITYEGITNNSYPTEVINGDNLSIDFIGDIPEDVIIYKDGIKDDSSKYSYSNGTLSFNDISGNLVIKSAKNLFNVIKLKTNGVDTNIDFSVASSETNGDGVNTFSGTENDQYPVYYYRGNVTNNNVKFANFCWKMVRTTDTGGVKLIYNGVPSDSGACNNTGTSSQIGTSAFNLNYNSPAYVGYMYGTVYTLTSKDLSSQTDTYVYGNDVIWDGTNYSLNENTMTSSSWSTDKATLATKYHYTCFNDTGICDKVYYINRDKNILLAIIGKEPLSNGINLIGSHIDSPRIDLKPNPLTMTAP